MKGRNKLRLITTAVAVGYTLYVAQTRGLWGEMVAHYLIVLLAVGIAEDAELFQCWSVLNKRERSAGFVIHMGVAVVLGLMNGFLWNVPQDWLLSLALIGMFVAWIDFSCLTNRKREMSN